MKLYRTMALALALTLGGAVGCDSMFEVTNPGPMVDEDLNNPAAFPGLVNGMSGDLSQAVDNVGYAGALLAGELVSTGFTPTWIAISEGRLIPSDGNGFWNNAQRARWVAEDGIRRMEEAGYDSNVLARAYLLAGISNRLLGENFCEAVIDGGAAEPHTVYFERAQGHLNMAVDVAERHGDAQIRDAANAALASVLAALGNWDSAASLAAQIPLDHRFEAIFSLNSSRETSDQLINYPLEHSEGTVWGTRWDTVTDDPRVPWEVALDPGGEPRAGRDGSTPWYRALKYTSRGDNVAMTKGTEMHLIRAEAALRNGDVETMVEHLDVVREFHGMEPLGQVDTDDAWDVLMYERSAELWLESRGLWDRRRWYAEGRDDFLEGRESPCFPVGQTEIDTNPNL